MSDASRTPESRSVPNDQNEVIAFLSDPSAYAAKNTIRPDKVECIQTHAAMVFLAGHEAYKIKRAVKYPYLDFSTLDKRRRICLHEYLVNRVSAPEFYLGVVPIARQENGRLAIGGVGKVVEWALHMRRFQTSDILGYAFDRSPPSDEAIACLAQHIAWFHGRAPQSLTSDGDKRIGRIVDELQSVLSLTHGNLPMQSIQVLLAHCLTALQQVRVCLKLRGRRGCIRRCHGDLHLFNIVLVEGRPVLFDALEFDEELATIDVLYDLAFLIMDLDFRGFCPAANQILNHYLHHRGSELDIYGLRAMPLFLALRAAIRAMVGVERAQSINGPARQRADQDARNYLDKAISYLEPRQPRLVAIGGFSGTGKSTLASALAPRIGPSPGAIHLRSDWERKAHFGVALTERLAADTYTPEASAAVYKSLFSKARRALRAGSAVVVDATFQSAAERRAMEELGCLNRVPFTGLWLTVDKPIAVDRVRFRTGDASDATAEVVESQFAHADGSIDWQIVDASGNADATLAVAERILDATSQINRPALSVPSGSAARAGPALRTGWTPGHQATARS